ncbi:MAG: hypothetical protein U0V54_16120 [Saprospiraceae bacterium]|nr:hypothetical protein [Bacteroidales bacterium]
MKTKNKGQNLKSPFKEKESFIKEINNFLLRFNSIIHDHSDKISAYFEMSCFNYIIQYYEDCGFEVEIKNLRDKKYRYKCSTTGNQENFSYFSARKGLNPKNDIQIHHNLAIESMFDNKIYTTPDITVIRKASIESKKDFYKNNITFCYVKNCNLITFAEVKHFNPYPELLFNFIGTVNELKGIYHPNPHDFIKTEHFAPFLMISGKSTDHTDNIRRSLISRYNINIIYDLFGMGLNKNSKLRHKTVEKLKYLKNKENKKIDEKSDDELVLPF